MTSIGIRMADRLVRLTIAFLALILVASCGSGAVSNPAPTVNDPTRITILPATATVFSGLPTTFVISGGTGSYIVTSSNQSILRVAGGISGGALTVIPEQVTADTAVTLTVRDTGTAPLATAALTVKPGTVNNDITITPSSTQGDICPTGTLCSGGDAVVTATLSLGGVPLAGRGVRFEVISGDFAFITSGPGATSETLDTSVTVVSDETGKARARIRAFSNAPNQTALLQVTDLVSGAFQRTSFVIAQATGASPGFFVSPSSAVFQGSREDRCADGTGFGGQTATFYIFGGTAPYTVSNTSSAFSVTPSVVAQSGGSFTVSPNGPCVDEPGAPIIIRDASGRTTTVTVANIRGTDQVPELAVSPSTVSLSSCSSIATVTAVGGTGNYTANSGSGSVMVTALGSGRFRIQRNPTSPASPSPVNVGISDGVSTVTVTVNLTGAGAGQCPTPGFAANPTTVTLSDCTGTAQVALSGGSGTYNAVSDNSAITATVTGSVLSIKRAAASGPTAGGTVTATDGFSNIPITVNTAGPGALACP